MVLCIFLSFFCVFKCFFVINEAADTIRKKILHVQNVRNLNQLKGKQEIFCNYFIPLRLPRTTTTVLFILNACRSILNTQQLLNLNLVDLVLLNIRGVSFFVFILSFDQIVFYLHVTKILTYLSIYLQTYLSFFMYLSPPIYRSIHRFTHRFILNLCVRMCVCARVRMRLRL